MTLNDPFIDNYLLTSLLMGTNYTVMLVATSEHLPSDVVLVDVTLGERGIVK